MVDLSVDFCGLQLKNPIIAAAGPITAHEEMVKRLADEGVAAVVSKTGFVRREYETWVGRKHIFPYRPVYKYQGLDHGRLLSLPTLCDIPVEEMAGRLERMKKAGIPVIGSIMGLSLEGYVESARILVDAGADAIELDLCCTIPEFSSRYRYAGQNVNFTPGIYARLVKAVKKSVPVPVGVKSTVSLYVYAKLFEALLRCKVANALPDFITLVGQLDQNPGIDPGSLRPLVPDIPTMGWQGTLAPLTYSALATFSSTLGTGILPFSASGGIRNHEDAITAITMGATTVQLQTAILDRGPAMVGSMLRNMEKTLDTLGITRVRDCVGMVSGTYIPSLVIGRFMRERDGLFGTVRAEIDSEACNGCGTCASVCTEQAITIKDGKAVVIKDLCRGCNLCVLKCPTRHSSSNIPRRSKN